MRNPIPKRHLLFRSIPALLIAALPVACFASAAEPPYPLWDNVESVADYAKRVNLPPAKTLDLGNGVKMELVLIPAGKFIMGAAEPQAPKDAALTGAIILELGVICALGILITIVLSGLKRDRKNASPLLWLLLVVAFCIALLTIATTYSTILNHWAYCAALELAAALCLVALLLAFRIIRISHRPKFSLRLLMLFTLALSVALYGYIRWHNATEAWSTYDAAKYYYDNAASEEKPAHPVTLTRPFYIGTTPVTQRQYWQVIGANPSFFTSKIDSPVENISWDETQAFCHVINTRTKQIVRLPTEAEWEYSCRAGTNTTYYSGDSVKDLDRVAWYRDNSMGRTHPVGQKEPNGFSLYDMHGNVHQWCQDFYDANFYVKSTAVDPQGPKGGSERVVRGGAWEADDSSCRSAYRIGRDPRDRRVFGFRVVLPALMDP